MSDNFQLRFFDQLHRVGDHALALLVADHAAEGILQTRFGKHHAQRRGSAARHARVHPLAARRQVLPLVSQSLTRRLHCEADGIADFTRKVRRLRGDRKRHCLRIVDRRLCEGGIVRLDRHLLPLLLRIAVIDVCQFVAVIEGSASDVVQRGRQGNACQTSAGVKGIIFDPGKTLRQNKRRKLLAAAESRRADSLGFFGDRKAAALSGREEQERLEILAEKDAICRSKLSVSFLRADCFEHRAAPEGAVAQRCERGRQMNAFQRGAVIKRRVADHGQTVWKSDRFQRDAGIKGRFPDHAKPLGKAYTAQRRTAHEGSRADFLDAFRDFDRRECAAVHESIGADFAEVLR